jgi:putative PIN family toxin of toxin-antitoxin system
MIESLRAVFDCNIFLQALGKPLGPAGKCLDYVLSGRLSLYTANFIFDEIQKVAAYPKIVRRFQLSDERVHRFLNDIRARSVIINDAPSRFNYSCDPDDARYIDLAVAVKAHLIVSRDKDFLDLMDMSRTEAVAFAREFPFLRIVDPVTFLREIAPSVD